MTGKPKKSGTETHVGRVAELEGEGNEILAATRSPRC